MTSQTRGLSSRKAITNEQLSALMSMRRRGMTCRAVSKALGIGESTVARYSSSWWQSQGSKKFKRYRKEKVVSTKLKATKSDVNPELTSEQIEYINRIYRSGNFNYGTFIGNLFIRIGKFFGGHNPV